MNKSKIGNQKTSDVHQQAYSQCNVVRSPLSVKELRVGNYLFNDGVIVKIDARSIFDIWDETKKYRPVPLTEENIIKLRREMFEDFKPIEFGKYPPKERQIENNFLSSWINEDYKIHLSPSYGTEWINDKPYKSKEIKFWFCWLYGSQNFVSLKEIRGQNVIRYVHQLQNLFYSLSGYDLVFGG